MDTNDWYQFELLGKKQATTSKNMMHYMRKSEALEDKVTALQEALEFYADKEIYVLFATPLTGTPVSKAMFDMGKKAQEALDKQPNTAKAAAMLWQPMETAKKDGTFVDLWCEQRDYSMRHPLGWQGRYTDCSYGKLPDTKEEGWRDEFGRKLEPGLQPIFWTEIKPPTTNEALRATEGQAESGGETGV